MQRSANMAGESAGHEQGIVFLHPRDRVADLIRENSIDRAAIVAEATQRRLECADVSRIGDQAFSGLEIIGEAAIMAGCEVGSIQRRALVERPILISSGQWITRMIKSVKKKCSVRKTGLRDTKRHRQNKESNNSVHDGTLSLRRKIGW